MPLPLIVDGPLKGKDYEIPDSYFEQGSFQYYPEERIPATPNPPAFSQRQAPVTYRRHFLGILGHRLMIWSLERDFQRIAFDDLRALFDVIISDRGKAAEHK